MKELIINSVLSERNILIENESMPNGETRFRVKWQDFSGVNITTSSENPNWQNAHYHKVAKEVYIVQKGKILIAIEKEGKVTFDELQKGDIIVIEPLVKHNVYMFEDTMTYVVKCGQTVENDWYGAEELDKISKEYKVR
jgi:mannose-6-phosphate isomerase-like protein (cupin superfamily)